MRLKTHDRHDGALEGPALYRFIDAYKDGVSIEDLCDRFSISIQTVQKLLKKHKVPLRTKTRMVPVKRYERRKKRQQAGAPQRVRRM